MTEGFPRKLKILKKEAEINCVSELKRYLTRAPNLDKQMSCLLLATPWQVADIIHSLRNISWLQINKNCDKLTKKNQKKLQT